MSRIGKLPIIIPAGAEISVTNENVVIVKGPLGKLSQAVDKSISVNISNNTVVFTRENDEKQERSFHGLYRSLVSNMLKGVTVGYEIKQELVGVGYKANANQQLLELSLGFSHQIVFEVPEEVKVETITEKGKNPIIVLKSIDKQLIGQVAAKIRSFRKPEPYKGKGIKFVGEVLRRKAGKTASK